MKEKIKRFDLNPPIKIAEDLIKAPDGQCCRIVAKAIFDEIIEMGKCHLTCDKCLTGLHHCSHIQELKKKWCEK